MRDFFINCLEVIISMLLIAGGVAVAATAIGALIGSVSLTEQIPAAEGPYAAATIALGGGFALLVIGGILFLGLGIYRNTLRTADALELLITLRR